MARTAPTAATGRTAPTAAGRAALAFFAVTALVAAKLTYLHDEGIFSFDLAAALPHAFWPMLFFFKAKAPIVLLYALPAQLGLRAFLVAHAAVAAGAVWLTAETARRMGANPLVAAAALVTSIGFVVAGASGFPNSDGAFFLALFLWLRAGERHLLAGLVLGMLPFARYELTFAALVFLDRRSFPGALIFPALYVGGGALYHHDPLWLLHTFSNYTQPEAIRRYQAPGALDLVKFVAASLAVNFSLLGVLGLAKGRGKLLVAAGGTYGLLIWFAALDWFGVDRSLRYHVAPLPLVALMAAPLRPRLAALQAATLAFLFTGYGSERHRQNHELMDSVKKSTLWRGQPLYTDVHIARYDRCAGVDAWMLANDSIAYALDRSLLRGRDQVLAALARQRFVVDVTAPRKDALYLIDPERDHRWRDALDATQPVTQPIGRWRLYGWP
jgi:hypothetical protein